MRIIIVSNELPYPANHGGRIDSWNRIITLHDLGVKIFLITWNEIVKGDVTTEESIEKVKANVEDLKIFPVNRGVRRIINLIRFPSLVSARLLTAEQYENLLRSAKIFKPSMIFIDGLYGALVGLRLSKDLACKTAIRLQNIEHKYFAGQLSLAHTIRQKVSILLATLHLRKYEYKMIKLSDTFYDISIDDHNFWVSKGMAHGCWMPPIYINRSSSEIDKVDFKKNDICFFGNLNTPNNVNGIVWFVDKVLPFVLDHNPRISVVIMGSNPSNIVKNICAKYNQITLIGNPEKPDSIVKSTKILINPVQFSSGVNIKAIDMLFTDKMVVSTSAGIKGLPNNIKECFCIADTPDEFKRILISILDGNCSKIDVIKRESMRALFSVDSLKLFFNM